ncbi:hypothetical protein [Okeania sp. SIO2B9]|uniref:hypothetical protein n=1 Tax=Okeania sp. SIO2B9 TaxID=2607782 RepID=UPI00142C22D3|nr:hypothetical protein [Okeania sp. SIO2B9]NES92951.1 hypothetical protein [Okeania sp. SIO2B9]
MSSGAALLLTVLRPAIRLYQYLVVRLSMIRRELLHPRADIIELRNRFVNIEKTVEYLGTQLSIENPESFRSKQQQHSEITRKEFSRLAVTIEDLRNTNQAEHHQLARDFEKAISRLSTDGKFLNHVQEIIRFIKEA